ncbi:peptidase M14 [Flavobacterium sp. D11R37]|uniref:M14 family metallopeptidase n=1 Tax=Flavobacterium coralii TaxID=2838017 RepID=UPI001CA66CB6|nr:M14 metallopeptidase family protein [Flavobacterium coralii]MBY8962080.1 peptidase M14 [Flavobacterium coralii]
MEFEQLFTNSKEQTLYGRYITNEYIEPLLNKYKEKFKVTVIGNSVLGKPVYNVIAGSGSTRIFIWSQMHGNESTTTKAVIDLLNWLACGDTTANRFLTSFTFYIIPIANPDGAELYTRENANGIDLNRDALNLTQPESKILRKAFEDFKPHYCYNMHDQRTIFGLETEDGAKPATVSFLAPAYNEEREINDTRQQAINLIVAMNTTLQKYIPGQVGRFDDSFNINCIGDSFQAAGVPTVLFEAGHYPGDYEREETRKFIFFALLSGFNSIYENVLVKQENSQYFNIPQNKKIFYDIVYKNVKINYENKEKIAIFASQYKEVLIDKSVIFQAFISEIDNLEDYHGHEEYDGKEGLFVGKDNRNFPVKDEEADFFIAPDRRFINGREIKQQ